MMKKIKVFFNIVLIIITGIYALDIINSFDLNLTKEEFMLLFTDKSKLSNNKLISEFFTSVSFNNPSNPLVALNNKENNNQKDTVKTISKPLIYIYNTHQQEQYNGEQLKDYNLDLTVLTASYILEDCLSKQGITSIVETTNMKKLLNKKGYSYDKSYQLSRNLILDAKKQYNSINYYIDIHRDSVRGNISTVEINNKSYARPMFVIGMNNKKYQENLQLMEQLNQGFNSFNKELSRGIYKRNSIYNQDLNANVILIEIGGLDSTLDEVYNTTCLLADIIVNVIGGING